MPTSLVTGGAGFIGAHLARELLARGHTVVVMDDLSGGFLRNVPAGATFVQGSITDPNTVEDLFQSHRFDYVFHLAAYAAEGLSHFIRRFNYTNNLLGSVNLLNQSVLADVKRFVFTSSIAVYGAGPLPLKEDHTARPEDPYGVAKLAVEMDLHAAHEMFGIDYTVFRPHNVYGEYQHIGDRYRNVVGIFMNQILRGRPMTIFGDGRQTRAFSYIDDVAPVMAEAIEVPEAWNQVFNIGADQPYALNELAEAVGRAMGVTPVIQYVAARPEVVHAHSSHDKLRRTFGDHPHTPLDDGLQRMAAWVRVHGARVSKPFDGIEVTKHLPAVWRDE